MFIRSDSSWGKETHRILSKITEFGEIRIFSWNLQMISESWVCYYLGIFKDRIFIRQLEFFKFFINFLNISYGSDCGRLIVRLGIFCTQIKNGLQSLALLILKQIIKSRIYTTFTYFEGIVIFFQACRNYQCQPNFILNY